MTSAAIAVVATNRRVKEDSAIGVLFAGMFALGVVLISSSRNFTGDLASFLFGNVLGVTRQDIWLSVIVGGIVLLLIVLLYRELLITSFDRVGAEAMGLPVFGLDMLLLVLISLTIVVSLRAGGQHPRRRDAGHTGGHRASSYRSTAGNDRSEFRDRRIIGRCGAAHLLP